MELKKLKTKLCFTGHKTLWIIYCFRIFFPPPPLARSFLWFWALEQMVKSSKKLSSRSTAADEIVVGSLFWSFLNKSRDVKLSIICQSKLHLEFIFCLLLDSQRICYLWISNFLRSILLKPSQRSPKWVKSLWVKIVKLIKVKISNYHGSKLSNENRLKQKMLNYYGLK